MGEKWHRLGAFSGPSSFFFWNNWLSSASCPSPTIVFIPTWWWSMNLGYPACSLPGTEEGALPIGMPCAGFSGFTIGSLEVKECLPPTSRNVRLCVLNYLQMLKEWGYTRAALLQSSTNASTHNCSSEIIRKTESWKTCNCVIPRTFIFPPWKIKSGKCEAGELGLCMLLLSLLPF